MTTCTPAFVDEARPSTSSSAGFDSLEVCSHETQTSNREGYLLKQGRSFQRWKKRYFKLKNRKLYYAATQDAVIFNEIDLVDFSVAECGSKNAQAFQIITPFVSLVLCAETRKEMDGWLGSLKAIGESVSEESPQVGGEQYRSVVCGEHTWYVCSHTRPTYCNECRETLSGMAWNGLSCEVCKIKAHKRCAVKVREKCKWTILETIPLSLRIDDDDGYNVMPHQWLEGNLPMSVKCAVCEKTCGSILRLQDWRCLWCRVVVHGGGCKDSYPRRCPLESNRLSVLPPVALQSVDVWGNAKTVKTRNPPGSPLVVLVNTKSGENQGVKVLRRFKRLLNPAQVFDLMARGPTFGLNLMNIFDSFRVLVCGGDGSVGWVFSVMDKLDIHSKCQLGVLPLGTGNDMARVLGWGNAFDDSISLPQLMEKFERAHTQMLDRWRILMYEGPTFCTIVERKSNSITKYEDSVAAHLSKILSSSDNAVVISSAKVLCETVKDFLKKIDVAYNDLGDDSGEGISKKCHVLQEKLDNLLLTLQKEAIAAEAVEERGIEAEGSSSDSDPISAKNIAHKNFAQRDALMCRADSLKKAVRQIIDHAEKAVDEQNHQTRKHSAFNPRFKLKKKREKKAFTGIRSHTSPSALLQTVQDSFDSVSPPNSPHSLTVRFSHDEETNTSGEASPAHGMALYGPSLDSDSTVPEDPQGSKSAHIIPSSLPGFVTQNSHNSSGSAAASAAEIAEDIFGANSNIKIVPPTPIIGTPSSSHHSSIGGTEKLALPPSGSCRFQRSESETASPSTPPLSIAPSYSEYAFKGLPTTPFLEFEDIPIENYKEKRVMNNYFGVGLDAKIAFEFHQKREECSDKARSRSKLYMWYGMLGTKELLQRTYRNLEQTVHLECDGQRIQLPSLQGIVILNIPSYQGGANFWGSHKDGSVFAAQSFDDRILEVVAVFGIIHCATSRVVRLQNHKIAQCRTVKIIITGTEPIPVQVDGEPWMQPPGYIIIDHKNRGQVLVRNRQFEATLKAWTEIQTREEQKAPHCLRQMFTEEECQSILNFIQSANSFVQTVKKIAGDSPEFESAVQETLECANVAIQRLYPPGKKLPEISHVHYHLMDSVGSIKLLVHQLSSRSGLMSVGEGGKDAVSHAHQGALEESWKMVVVDLREISKILTVSQSLLSLDARTGTSSSPELPRASGEREGFRPKAKTVLSHWLRTAVSKFKSKDREYSAPPSSVQGVNKWSVEEVGEWLSLIGLGQYSKQFTENEIRGSELLKLERRDLKDLGVDKVGHIKRLQTAICELQTTKRSTMPFTSTQAASKEV